RRLHAHLAQRQDVRSAGLGHRVVDVDHAQPRDLSYVESRRLARRQLSRFARRQSRCGARSPVRLAGFFGRRRARRRRPSALVPPTLPGRAAGRRAAVAGTRLRAWPFARRACRAPGQAAGNRQDLGPARHGKSAQVRRTLRGGRGMKLARHPRLDALCAEYLVGTLRGAARRRFERSLRDEPLVAARLQQLIDRYAPTPSEQGAVTPRADGWQRLQRELKLPGSQQQRWYSMLAPWQWVTAAVAVIAPGISLGGVLSPREPPPRPPGPHRRRH